MKKERGEQKSREISKTKYSCSSPEDEHPAHYQAEIRDSWLTAQQIFCGMVWNILSEISGQFSCLWSLQASCTPAHWKTMAGIATGLIGEGGGDKI